MRYAHGTADRGAELVVVPGGEPRIAGLPGARRDLRLLLQTREMLQRLPLLLVVLLDQCAVV